MENELLPCPFCGNDAQILYHKNYSGYKAHCLGSRKCPMPSVICEKEKDAIKLWNTRPSSASPKELNDRTISVDLDAPPDNEAIEKTKELFKELNAPRENNNATR